MGAAKHTTSATLFERKVRQAMVRKEQVFLFDQNWSAKHGAGYHSTVYRLAKLADLPLVEFEGFALNESKLVSALVDRAATINSDVSNFRLLIESMEQRQQGVVVIHNAHKMANKAVHLLARLVSFAKRRKLRWKFVLFAEVKNMDELALAQLSVDRTYPRTDSVAAGKPMSARRRPRNRPVKAGNGFFEKLSERIFS